MNIFGNNIIQVGSIVLFGIGFTTLLLNNNMIKKIIGMNIMDTSIFLFFITIGYINGGKPPINDLDPRVMVNPIPSSLMLTGIVVAICTTAFMLALTIKFYHAYGTIELDEILAINKEEN